MVSLIKVCIACDRPNKLSYNHANDEPTLQFIDGYGVYARHGKSFFKKN